MAIDFPNSPISGQTFTVGYKTWRWDGTKWNVDQSSTGPRQYVQDTPPSGGVTGDLWLDTTTGIQYVFYDSYWIEMGTAYLSSSLPVYASTAARLAAFPVPIDGQGSYLNAGDSTEGPEFYNGTAWRKPWNMPWGYINKATSASSVSGIGAVTDVITVTITAVLNRRYKITALVTYATTAVACQVATQITDNTPGVIEQVQQNVPASNYATVTLFTEVNPAAGSQTYRLRMSSSGGTVSTVAVSGGATILYVEDVGPNGAPS